jgi:hypothetical protein
VDGSIAESLCFAGRGFVKDHPQDASNEVYSHENIVVCCSENCVRVEACGWVGGRGKELQSRLCKLLVSELKLDTMSETARWTYVQRAIMLLNQNASQPSMIASSGRFRYLYFRALSSKCALARNKYIMLAPQMPLHFVPKQTKTSPKCVPY